MSDENLFRQHAESALKALEDHLYAREEQEDAFETEVQGGVLQILFELHATKFVITANAPVRQIWISALSTSFKLDWDEALGGFVYKNEQLIPLVDRLIGEQLAA